MKWALPFLIAMAFSVVHKTADYAVFVPEGYDVQEGSQHLYFEASDVDDESFFIIYKLPLGAEAVETLRYVLSDSDGSSIEPMLRGMVPSGETVALRRWEVKGKRCFFDFTSTSEEGSKEYLDCVLIIMREEIYLALGFAEKAGVFDEVKTSLLKNFPE